MELLSNNFGVSYFQLTEYHYRVYAVCDYLNSFNPHYNLELITCGEGILEYNQQAIKIHAGDIIFIPVGSQYRITWSGYPNISYISMHFYFISSPPLPRDQRLGIQVVPSSDNLRQLFFEAISSFNQDIAGRLIALSGLYKILGTILPQFKYDGTKTRDERIESVVLYIEAHYKEPLTINKLASVAHMSAPHLHPKFKEAMGMPPIEYRNHVRIRFAILELLKNCMSIQEIARAVGFDSAVSFRRAFHKEIGCSPSQYVSNYLKQTTEVGVFNGTGQNEPIEFKDFFAYRANMNADFTGFSIYLPTYTQIDSKCLISIYEWNSSLEKTLAHNPIVYRFFDPLIDGAGHRIDFSKLPPGEYLFYISDISGRVGVWANTNATNTKGVSYIGSSTHSDIEPLLFVRFTHIPIEPFLACTSI